MVLKNKELTFFFLFDKPFSLSLSSSDSSDSSESSLPFFLGSSAWTSSGSTFYLQGKWAPCENHRSYNTKSFSAKIYQNWQSVNTVSTSYKTYVHLKCSERPESEKHKRNEIPLAKRRAKTLQGKGLVPWTIQVTTSLEVQIFQKSSENLAWGDPWNHSHPRNQASLIHTPPPPSLHAVYHKDQSHFISSMVYALQIEARLRW